MKKIIFFLFVFFISNCFSQQSDFAHIDFTAADKRAKSYKSRNLLKLNQFTYKLTKGFKTDIEKFRVIYLWITSNVSNDYRLYALNKRKRDRFEKDSIKLLEWNSKFKKKLFKKLLRKKRTVCTGYAYLLKEMCSVVGIDAKIVNGFGRANGMEIDDLEYPNHSWNIVKLNNKWYLCDPTWASGTSYPEEGKFIFDYNNGFFLTEPNLFIFNHYPLYHEYSLLKSVPSIKEFAEKPLLYGNAFNLISEHISPAKMHHVIQKDSTFTFQYKLKEKIDLNKVKLIFVNAANENNIKPKVIIHNNILTVNHTFKKRGYYDVHLYFDKDIIATYVFKIIK